MPVEQDYAGKQKADVVRTEIFSFWCPPQQKIQFNLIYKDTKSQQSPQVALCCKVKTLQ